MHHFKAPHDMFVNARRYDRFLEDVQIHEPENLFSPPNGSVASKGYGSGLGLHHHAPWRLGAKLGISNQLD